MAIYDNLPYTNFHELNADWLLKTVKDTREYLDQVKAQLDEVEIALEDFNAKYPELSDLSDVFTVSGNDVSIPGNFTATQFIGALLGNASTATTAANATNADHATTAGSATNATNAVNATNANYATTAGSATNATNAVNATNANYATNAGHATTADSASIGVATGAEVFVTTPDSTRFPTGATSNMTVRAVNNDSTLAPDTGAWLLLDVSEPSNTNIGNPYGGVYRIAIPLDPNEPIYDPTARRYIKCRPFMYTTSDRDTIQSISGWYNIWTDNSTPS